MAKAPQKSKDAKAKAASGGGKKSKKKWSKGKSRDKLQNLCLFDKATFDRVMREVPKYKVHHYLSYYSNSIAQVITPSIVSDRMKIRGSLARRVIKELHTMGKIKMLIQHGAQMVYSRAIEVVEEETEQVEVAEKASKKSKKQKK